MRALAALVLLAAVATACAEPAPAFDAKAVPLVVEMRDYSVKPSVDVVKAGTLKIGIRNLATMQHDFVVLRTDLAPDKLPYDGGRAQVIETGLVGKQIVEAQRSASLTVTLEPGNYVLICNIAGHYQLGMRAALKVEP